MKKLSILILTCFSLLLCRSQEKPNNLNTNINDIIFVKFLKDVDVNFPILISTPVSNPKTNLQHTNLEVLFDEDAPDLDFLIANSGLNRLELHHSLDIEFFPPLTADTTIQIQAKKKKRVLYNIKFIKDGNDESYTISLPDGSLTKEIAYNKGQFMSLNVIKPGARYILINEVKNDSLFCQTAFNSKTGQYSLTDYFYHNNILTHKVLYQSSSGRDTRVIKKTWKYKYDSEGKIISISGQDNKGLKTDSISYFYTGPKLNSIVNYEKDAQSTIYYLPESGLMSDYLFEGYENAKIHFEYNKEGKIAGLRLYNTKKQSVENYIFEYNSSSNLASIKKFINQNISNDMIIKKQYIFSYNNEQMLTSMLITKKKGKIKKEIEFEINYLN